MELSIAAPPGAILRRAMSQENVELVRQALEYWNRGDLDAASEFWDDDVVLRMAEGWPERVFYGKDEVRSLVVTVRKGKAVLMEFFWDHQEALEAVGLRE
jgi:ketosteroid isomerase-like protein